MSVLNVQLPESLLAELQEVSSEEKVSINQMIALAVAEKLAARRVYKQLATPGALAQRQQQLAGQSRQQLRADFEAIMSERKVQTPVKGDEMPAESEHGNISPRPARGDDQHNDERGGVAASAGNSITEPQHRAIMAIADKVFGHHSRDADLYRMIGKTVDQLTKTEASDLIGQLKEMQDAAENAPGSDDRETGFVRAGSRER